MTVRLDEPRCHTGISELSHVGVGAYPLRHVGAVADGDDLPPDTASASAVGRAGSTVMTVP